MCIRDRCYHEDCSRSHGPYDRLLWSIDQMCIRDRYYDTSWFDSMGRSYYLQLTWKLGGKPL